VFVQISELVDSQLVIVFHYVENSNTLKNEPLAITHKIFRSALLNLLDPSAIFNTMLREARLN